MKRGLGGARPAMGDHRALPTRFGGFGANQSTSTLSYLAEPPSLTAVSDPHVVVLIKNILKKDSTTKARALEELLNHVQGAAQDIDDALLEIWVEIYPRVSIDNARRVRELSHTLQYELLKAGRKRMERRLSGIVATWIAGLFDRDRGVSRAAEAGLTSFLNTPEKMNAFWLKCQAQILDFAVDSIRETPDTLSDERSTTKEDAEAKYYRVVYASLCLINGLLQRASAEDLSTFESKYEDYFEGDTVWKNIQCPDSSVRRAVCHLMFACLDRSLPYADSKFAKQAFLVGGLQTSHPGTALEYVRALSKLTEIQPQIWTSAEGKKSPMTRLLAFIAKGSQGSPPLFWDKLDQLLQVLLVNDATLGFASDVSNAIQKGITHRAEPKTNTSSAWKCYIDVAKRLLHALSPEDQLSFASEHFFPLFERFLFSSPGSTDLIPLGPNSMGILVEAQAALMQGSAELNSAAEREWNRLSTLLCENISGVLPEVSKDFRISQERLGEEGRRWFGLVGEMRRASDSDTDITIVVNGPSTSVINHCLEVLRKRNLKPFGAARVVEFALSNSGFLFEEQLGQQLVDFLSSIETIGMQMFVDSPSMLSTISSLRLLRGIASCRVSAKKIWKSWAVSIIGMPQSDARDTALVSLISSDDISQTVQETDGIQDFILKHVREGTHGEDFLATIMKYDALSPHASHKLVTELVQGLDAVSEEQLSKLRSLEILVKSKPTLFQNEDIHTRLVRQLLSLEEMRDPQISAKATGVRSLLSGDLDDAHLPVVSIIQQNLESAGPQCLGIETLVQQARDALKGGASLEEIFPSTNAFMQALLPFLGQPVDPSLVIMNVTGGAVLLVNPQDMSSRPPPRDSQGRSIPVRVALYVCHLLDSNPNISTLPVKFQVELLYLQGLIVQMVSDQVSLLSDDGLWKSLETNETMEQASWLVSTGRSQLLDNIRSCNDWSGGADGESQVMPQLVELLTRESRVLTPTALYSSRILSEIMQSVAERQGIPHAWESSFLNPEALKIGADTVLVTTAVLTGFGDALRPLKSINTLCNRLVSDIAAAKLSSEKTAILLTLLTLCGSVYDSGALPIPSNRIVFAVKQVADWLDDETELSPEFASECLRCLAQLLPCIKDVYGSFWEKTLHFCMISCENASKYPLNRVLPLLQAALKLVKDLSEMEEVNDDLEESLSDISKQKGPVMIELLRLDRDVATQPLEIVDRLLCREVEKLAISQLPEAEDLYSLVASESATLQTTAFVLLHRIVPEQQQKKSVNIMLDNLNARLPDELLSLLLDAPTLEQFTDEMLATFPVSVRGYLLSWELIFDAYAASPFKIRADFTESLKAENPMGPLLDFMFDVLGHSAGYPLKLEKEGISQDQIRNFDIKLADAEIEEKSMHWLMAHLFYLILKYVPGLFRTWYQDCRSKQTKMAVESWTESYFSTLVIEDALDDVQTWLDSEDFNSSNEADIGVKVSKSGKEVTISYEIDESEGAMAIKLPNNFPIEGVTVRGIRRVAVNEKKWQSWIMTTQGVITFANGNIIDGVQAFRRNLTGAIRGHSECAICYSVISADQRVPEKSCTTCKNLFHRLCLYKWFQTSNNNTCPLCRTPIDFAGASNLKRRN